MPKLAVLCAVIFLAITSVAQAHTVDSTADLPDANVGDLICEASNGKCTLRAAIDECNADMNGINIIRFESEGMVFYLDSGFQTWANITIEGKGSTHTIIDGGDTAFGFHVNLGSLTLTGLTIQNTAQAIYSPHSDSSVIVRDSSLISNSSTSFNGGAIEATNITLTDCTLVGNSAGDKGGAVYVSTGIPGTGLTVSGCHFASNSAALGGGAIYVWQVYVFSIEDSTFDGNSTPANGGAIAIEYGPTIPSGSITGCEITNNTAANGGGLWIASDQSDLEITETDIGSNDAASGGGIYLDSTAMTLTLRESSIYSNTATGDGGGVKSVGSETIEMVNSTVSQNKAQADGGGLHLSSNLTEGQIFNSTITGNQADSEAAANNGKGGGIYVTSGGGLVYIRNSILADNEDLSTSFASPFAPDCYATLTSSGYNLIGFVNPLCDIQGDTAGNLVGTGTDGTIDPLLGPLLKLGFWPTFVHSLTDASPARDAGDPAGCVDLDGSPLLRDQIGRQRPVGLACDMGAYEHGVSTFIFADGFDGGDFSKWSDAVGN